MTAMSLPTGVKITDIDFELRAADDQVAMVWINHIRVKRGRCRLKQHPAGSHLAMTALPFCPITAYGALALLLTPDALNEPGVPRGLCAQCAGIIFSCARFCG